MRIEELQTPVPVIDYEIVRRNVRRLQDYCDQHRFKLRPHIKTHKLPFLAHEQCRAGAIGITVQKLGEAEAMVQAGMTDILITYNIVGAEKAERLANLTYFARVGVAIDNSVALETVAAASKRAAAPIDVLIEFESGGGRQGVQTPQEALDLAKEVVRRSGLQFKGLMTYPTSKGTGDFLSEALPLFERADIPVEVISCGGTPTALESHSLAPLTELRVGTYIYNDRMMMAAGAASLDDCAFAITATVVSRPTNDRAILDSGSKTLSSDLMPSGNGEGYGILTEYPEAVIASLKEEHGIVDLTKCAKRPEIGERVRIIPNHVCVVTNLHNQVHLHRDGEVLATMPVLLRGMTV
jgi:D-serine deaminase-like pyridoxal phosphate-dependent protein